MLTRKELCYTILFALVVMGIFVGLNFLGAENKEQATSQDYPPDTNPMDIACSEPRSSMAVEVCVAYYNSKGVNNAN
jgi:hypothetical protein